VTRRPGFPARLDLGTPAPAAKAAAPRLQPPPAAAPFTQATIGCGQRRMAMTISLIRRWAVRPEPIERSPEPSVRSFRSRPAQKASPAPCSTTTRTSRRQ